MKTGEVIPDVINTEPPSKLSVIFEDDLELNYGTELTPTQVKNIPKVEWTADPNKFYLLANIDPDAPSRENPLYREMAHWLVGNIPGNNISATECEEIVEYRGSGAPKGTGLHRYVFLVYEQPKKLTFDEPRSTKLSRANRKNFSIRNFAKKYNLGNPVAGNYYVAQWDKYVDERNQFLTGQL